LNINKTIKYINENTIDDMVAALMKSGKNLDEVDKSIRLARVEFQTKSQNLQWALQKVKETSDGTISERG
jgi:hypothetical protein